ncbi:MAG: PTS sugar transporter subunit IIA [candidate division Zixibacteria bacterium]
MNLARFFDKDLINIDLKARTKAEAVDALADLFCEKYPHKNKDEILKAVLEREKMGSTSFGRGFAFPHARTGAVDGMFIAVGIIRNGIDTDVPDGVPLKVICLLLTPRNISKLYLQTLSGLANMARRSGMLERIASLKSSDELIGLIENEGIRVQKALIVSDIMSEKPPTVSPADSLKTVANLMFKHKIDGVPVVGDDGKILGEVSERELLQFALPDYESFIANLANLPELEPFEDLLRQEDKVRVKDVMNKDIVTTTEITQVVEVAALMLFKNVDRVIVLRDEKIVGIVSRSDIVSKIIRG